jgi:chromosomal replication initiator protein
LGKTHLLQAIGHYLQSYYPHLRVKYVSTEDMLNDFLNSLGPLYERRQAEFRRQYREEVDVLLIDDIQFIEGKKEIQIEFFHTFEALHRMQKHIVLTSDRSPNALTELEPRLRSRFGSGVMADVQFPSLETRVAILRSKVVSNKLEVSAEVLEYIATRVQSSVRELEGALLTAASLASLDKEPLDLALAERALKDVLPTELQVLITPEIIQNQVADYYQLSVDALVGQGRTQSIVLARQVAMYLCRELTNLSLPKIGQSFGSRDHTTVMHADRKIKGLLRERHDLFDQVTDITTRIRTAVR